MFGKHFLLGNRVVFLDFLGCDDAAFIASWDL